MTCRVNSRSSSYVAAPFNGDVLMNVRAGDAGAKAQTTEGKRNRVARENFMVIRKVSDG